jgi:hypothetical protein
MPARQPTRTGRIESPGPPRSVRPDVSELQPRRFERVNARFAAPSRIGRSSRILVARTIRGFGSTPVPASPRTDALNFGMCVNIWDLQYLAACSPWHGELQRAGSAARPSRRGSAPRACRLSQGAIAESGPPWCGATRPRRHAICAAGTARHPAPGSRFTATGTRVVRTPRIGAGASGIHPRATPSRVEPEGGLGRQTPASRYSPAIDRHPVLGNRQSTGTHPEMGDWTAAS